MNEKSTSLYATPSFAQGVAGLFDVMGLLHQYNDSPTGEEADYNALQSDWQAIGDDIRQAMDIYATLEDEVK